MSACPCDQVAADAMTIVEEIREETGVAIHFNLSQIDLMIEEIERAYASKVFDDFAELRESVLGRYNYLHDVEYTDYDRLLDKVFKRRAGQKQKDNSRRGKYAPFAPR